MNLRTSAEPAAWQHLSRQLARLAQAIAGLALALLVLVHAWQVFARYVLNASPGWTEPLALLLLSTLMSLAAASAVHADSHFSFRLLSESGSPQRRRWLGVLQSLLIAALGLLLAVGSIRLLRAVSDIKQAGIALSQGWLYLPLAVGGALIVAFALERAWLSWRKPAEVAR